jgi:hypothetical protein
MNKFTQETPQVQPPPNYSDRMGLHTTDAGVKVPLEQSIVTGILFAFTLGAVLFLFDTPILSIFKTTGVTVLLVATVHWINLHRHWWKLTKLENFLGVELDGIPSEPPKKITITVNKVKENQHIEQMQYTFPVSDAQIARFFTAVKTSTRGGKGISRREWTPKNVNGFSEGEWDKFYKELVRQQLVTIRGNECVLTDAGEEIADSWYSRAQEQTSPPPSEDI